MVCSCARVTIKGDVVVAFDDVVAVAVAGAAAGGGGLGRPPPSCFGFPKPPIWANHSDRSSPGMVVIARKSSPKIPLIQE